MNPKTRDRSPLQFLRLAVLSLFFLDLLAGPTTTSAGVICLMEGNNGTQECDFVKFDWDAGADRDNDLTKYHNKNDEARSARLRYVQPGTLIRVYDAPDGNSKDDWTEVHIKRAGWNVIVPTFEKSYEDEDVKVVYHRHNGLDGKVSRIEVRNDGIHPLIDRRRWMSQHWPLIADKHLIDLTLPASHDSGTESIDCLKKRWAETQYLSIGRQLDEGIRYFDLRVKKPKSDLIIYHGSAEGGTFLDALNQVAGWMAARQLHGDHELVILSIYAETTIAREVEAIVNAVLGPYLFRKDLLPENQRAAFHRTLTLSEILKSGPRVVVLVKGASSPDRFWHKDDIVYDEYADKLDSQAMASDQHEKYTKYDPNKLFILSWTLTGNEMYFIKHADQSLHDLTMKANLDLWHLLQGDWGDFGARGGRRVNFLNMDFVEEAATTDFALAMNGWDYRTTDDFWRRFSWYLLTDNDRHAWEALGWYKRAWNNGDTKPASASKKWAELNQAEQEAAAKLGFNEVAWDH
jgi:hypothetical protein